MVVIAIYEVYANNAYVETADDGMHVATHVALLAVTYGDRTPGQNRPVHRSQALLQEEGGPYCVLVPVHP
jgi:hypothetical protein